MLAPWKKNCDKPRQHITKQRYYFANKYLYSQSYGFLGGSDGKESSCNAGDLGWDDPLEEDMATHSSILAWRIPTDRGACQAIVHGGHKELDMTEWLTSVKAMVFPIVLYGCKSWTIKKAECQRIYAFELWCWRRLLGLQGDPTSPCWRKSVLNIHWNVWC